MSMIWFVRINCAVAAAAFCSNSLATALNPTLNVGDPAPPLNAFAWLKGEPVQRFKPGHVYVVDFWATWCGPCIEGMPHLSELQKKYAGKLTVIGVSAREAEHGQKAPDVAFVKRFVEKKGDVMAYTVAMDDPNKQTLFDAWMTAAGAYTLPTSFVVDGRGRVVWVGAPNGAWEQAFDTAVEQALEGKSDLEAARAIQDMVNEQTSIRLQQQQ